MTRWAAPCRRKFEIAAVQRDRVVEPEPATDRKHRRHRWPAPRSELSLGVHASVGWRAHTGMRLGQLLLASGVGLVACGGGSSKPASSIASTTTSTTSSQLTTTQITVPPTTARASPTGSGRTGSGIVEGDTPIRKPGPDLAVCATWEEDLRNPTADAPPRDITLQRLHEGDCPGY